jgi:poly(hydroxyalkanoate) depolymerase family esterase
LMRRLGASTVSVVNRRSPSRPSKERGKSMLFPNARARRTLAWLLAIIAAMATLWALDGHGIAQASTQPKQQRSHQLRAPAVHHRARHRVRHSGVKHHKGKSGSSGTAAPPSGLAARSTGLTSGSYSNSAGTLGYELYVPSTYQAGTPVPVVVALHGCGQPADTYRQASGWDTYAQSKGFIVLFPQQTSSRNYLTCWNWFQQADMQRGSGEPAIIAGMVSAIEKTYSVDTHHVYVAGFSAGGAMANVMGITYPDVFAAVGVGSGCEYNGLPCVGYQGPDPTQTGAQAYQAMGKYARVMPAIVFQGDADSVVAPANGPEIVKEWQVTDNYVLAGSANGPIPTSAWSAKLSMGWVPNGRMYTVSTYPDNHGNDLIEYWSINGMNHAWSGGSSGPQYSDPSGPSETAAMYAFFMNHPMP